MLSSDQEKLLIEAIRTVCSREQDVVQDLPGTTTSRVSALRVERTSPFTIQITLDGAMHGREHGSPFNLEPDDRDPSVHATVPEHLSGDPAVPATADELPEPRSEEELAAED